jgi:hypothetical protein
MLHKRYGYLVFPAIGLVIVAAIAFAAGYVRGHDEERGIPLGVAPGTAFDSPASVSGIVQQVNGSEIVIDVEGQLYTMALADNLVVEVVDAATPGQIEPGMWVALETMPDWKVNAVVTAVLVYAEDVVADGAP